MYITIAVVLFLASLVFHELGHAFAMQSCGVEIEAMGLGFGPHLVFGPFKCRFGNAVKFTLGLVPLGAYVKPNEKGQKTMEGLSYSDSARIMGAGILANFAFALCLCVYLALTHDPIFPNPVIVEPLLILGGGTILLWFGRKYVVPLAGFALLVYLLFTVTSHGGPTGIIGGPVVIGKVVVHNVLSLRQAISMGGFLSFSIGLMNMMPILPLDGGQMIRAILGKVAPWPTLFHERVSIVLFLALLGCVVYTDIIPLIFNK